MGKCTRVKNPLVVAVVVVLIMAVLHVIMQTQQDHAWPDITMTTMATTMTPSSMIGDNPPFVSSLETAHQERGCDDTDVRKGVCFVGDTFASLSVSSPQECCAACVSTNGCTSSSFFILCTKLKTVYVVEYG